MKTSCSGSSRDTQPSSNAMPEGTVSDVVLGPGEIVIVPKGVCHRPIATGEVRLVLVEPKATTHTGSVRAEMPVEVADQHWI